MPYCVKEIEWFDFIANRLPENPPSENWVEEAADTLANLFETLYREQGEEVIINTGYFDPEEDSRNEEVDVFTGWWYIELE